MEVKKTPATTALSIIYSADSTDQLKPMYEYLIQHDINADFWEDPAQEAYRNSTLRNLRYNQYKKPFAFHLIVPEAEAASAIVLVQVWEKKRIAILELLTKDVRRLFWTAIVSGAVATLAFIALFPNYLLSSPIAFIGGALIGYVLYPKHARIGDTALIYDVE